MDEYAQGLKKLYKAYSTVLHCGVEAKRMGQTVLANQFVAGLCSDLKTKVVGTEGNFEQLLVKARGGKEERTHCYERSSTTVEVRRRSQPKYTLKKQPAGRIIWNRPENRGPRGGNP